MSTSTQSSVRFHKGDKVWVRLPVGRVRGTVVEPRGPWGLAGTHLYRVSVPNDPYQPEDFVVADDELERLDPQAERAEREEFAPAAIMEFFCEGGLIAILLRNTREPVWLRRGTRGELTFTFVEGYSSTGGHSPPMNALHGEAIFVGKELEVVEFLKSFGLSASEARAVVAQVGTAP